MALDPGSGGIIGTKDLQQTVDKLNTAVKTLAGTVNNMSSTMSNGMIRSPSHATGAEDATFSSLPGMGAVPARYTGGYAHTLLGQTAAGGGANAGGAGLPSGFTRNMAGYGMPGATDYSAPAGPMMQNGSFYTGQGMIGGGGAGYSGGGPTLNQGAAGGGANGGGASFGAALGGMASWALSVGSSSLNNQLLFNSYGSSMANFFGGSGQAYQAQTFGTYNNTQNAMALSAQDAAAGGSTLSMLQNSANYSTNAGRGSSAWGATNAFSFANPGLGFAGGAGVAQALYNPQTALRLQQITGVASMNMGTGTLNSLASIQSGLGQRYGFSGYNSKLGTFNQKSLQANLNPESTFALQLQSLTGMNQSQFQDFATGWTAENRAAMTSGKSMSYVQNQLNLASGQYGTGKEKAAQGWLEKNGYSKTDMQSIQNLTASQTSQQNGENSGFNTGLQQSTQLLTQFNNALSAMLNGPLGAAVGYGKGLGAGGSLGLGGLGGGLLGGLGGSLLGRMGGGLLTRLLGGGASAAAGEGAADAVGAAGAGAAGVGVAGSAALPLAAVGGTLYGLSKIHNANGTNWLQQGPGGSGSGWNSWSALGHNLGNWFGADTFGKVGGLMRASMGGGAGSVSVTQSMTSQGRSAGSTMGSVSSSVQTAVRDAEQQVGKPYVYGGDSPATSFDCSGLVQWAYGQAGVRLPRTSEEQWAALKNRSVALNAVREGDIVFSAGSDGSASSPGHEALMISGNQIVEAPHTGANIRIRGFNPGEWQHAARPSGSTAGSAGATLSGSRNARSVLFAGNGGGGSGSGDSSLGMVGNSDSLLFSGTNGAGTPVGGLSGPVGGSALSSTSNSGLQTGATGGSLSASAIEKLWTSLGGPASAAGNMARIAMAESGDRPGIKQQGQPPGLTGWGLYQITPTSGVSQNGAFGNLLNASNNTRAAIALYGKDGYGPWSSDPVGAGLTGMATGGPIVVGERGPELFVPEKSGNLLNASQTSSLLRGTSAQTAQAPWTASPGQQLMLDMLSPASDGARGGSGTIQVTFGNITVQASGAATAQGTDVQALGQVFEQAVTRVMDKANLKDAIRQGNTG